MAALQRFRAWITGSKSDFPLFIVVLVLANLVAAGAFFRVDLTARNSYTLSEASRSVVKSIDQPLGVKVFFSANLPAPYNGVERYLRDLLVEYRGVGNSRFSYEFFDMEKPENKDMAESYGIYPAQIQELKNDEVGFKNAYMGLAIVYSDAVEPVSDITTADGLEYRLTTEIGKVISTADALAGLNGPVTVTLYASSALKAFKIQGYDKLDKLVKDAFDRVNLKNRGRLEYKFEDSVPATEVGALSQKYGLQKLDWEKQSGGLEAGSGLLGIVLEHGDRSRTVPITLARGLFGYGLAGLDDLERSLTDAVRALASNSAAVGYLTGHGEKNLYDDQNGAARFSSIVSDTYELKELDLSKTDIPANITTLIINGPKTRLGEAELYRIDQFLLRGGSVLALLDPFNEQQPQGGGMFGGQPTYTPIQTGLEPLLAKYGVKVSRNYVLDTVCYISRQQGTGEMPLYYAPIIGRKGLDRSNPVTAGLSDVIFLKSGEVALDLPKDTKDRVGTLLVSSSPEAWTMSDNVSLMPFAMAKPGPDKLASRGLVALVEGRFDSAFDAVPTALAEAGKDAKGAPLVAENRLTKSVQPGKLIVAGTSEIAGPSLIDQGGKQPTAMLVRNALDYLAGNPELAAMRVKGLSSPPLEKASAAVKLTAKSVNIYGLPLLVVIAGLLAWRLRTLKRARIQERYARDAAGKTKEN